MTSSCFDPPKYIEPMKQKSRSAQHFHPSYPTQPKTIAVTGQDTPFRIDLSSLSRSHNPRSSLHALPSAPPDSPAVSMKSRLSPLYSPSQHRPQPSSLGPARAVPHSCPQEPCSSLNRVHKSLSLGPSESIPVLHTTQLLTCPLTRGSNLAPLPRHSHPALTHIPAPHPVPSQGGQSPNPVPSFPSPSSPLAPPGPLALS